MGCAAIPVAWRGGRAVSTMGKPSPGRAEMGVARVRILPGLAGRMFTGLAGFYRDARGSTAIEYALIGSLIFLVAAGSIRYYVARMNGVYGQISDAVTQSN